MKTTSRREFITTAGSAAAALVGVPILGRCANADESTENNKHKATALAPLYELEKIPRVDIHMHAKPDKYPLTKKFVEVMDAGRIAVSVNLSGTREMLKQAAAIRGKWNARILICPRDSDTRDGLWWTAEDLATFKQHRCAGTKIWAQYHQQLLDPKVIKLVRRQGELGLPVIGLHIADPPEGKFWKPNYWDSIRETATLIERCPETTFIMAHGFWLMNEDRGLDLLADFFNENSNLNADLCAVYQWWDPPKPGYKKLRDFIIAHKDRLLFGTDGHPGYTSPERLNRIYRVLESADDELKSFFRNKTTLRGLDLPLDVLNDIYYRNAARLVPEVRKSLIQLGHKLS